MECPKQDNINFEHREINFNRETPLGIDCEIMVHKQQVVNQHELRLQQNIVYADKSTQTEEIYLCKQMDEQDRLSRNMLNRRTKSTFVRSGMHNESQRIHPLIVLQKLSKEYIMESHKKRDRRNSYERIKAKNRIELVQRKQRLTPIRRVDRFIII